MSAPRKMCFVLGATDHGPMIFNRMDMVIHKVLDDRGTVKAAGLGAMIMEKSQYEYEEILSVLALLDLRRASCGDGLVVLDCGANLGVHTIEMARHMTGWGSVVAFEPQQRVYYGLCGNITLNNCFNAQAIWAAVGKESGSIDCPVFDYQGFLSFGGVTLREDLPDAGSDGSNYVGQRPTHMEPVNLVTIDGMGLERLDFIKIDVEGMEIDVLEGGRETIEKHKPIILAEWIRCGKKALTKKLEGFGYRISSCDNMNIVAIHPDVELLAQDAAE